MFSQVQPHAQPRNSLDSLFDEISAVDLTSPPIPGLYFLPDVLLPQETCDQLVQYLETTFFTSSKTNQVMLFGRHDSESSISSLPPFLEMLLLELSEFLQPHLPPDIHRTIFDPCKVSPGGIGVIQEPRARQVILNRYAPGQGITAHVDLLGRFDDGILGVSLGSGCVMDFERVEDRDKEPNGSTTPEQNSWSLYLPAGSLLVLTSDARYQWTHGIAERTEDLVVEPGKEARSLRRGTRMSLTFRWLLPDAHIVGDM